MIGVNRRRVMGVGKKDNCQYITDGLLAYYDGIDNAGYGVHDPNATVWKNLAGDSDWDMSVHADWQSNGLYFDGTWNGLAPKVEQQDITIECVFTNANKIYFGWSYSGAYPRMSISYTSRLNANILNYDINGVYAAGYNHIALTLGNNRSVGTIYANGMFNVSSGVSTTSVSFSNNFRLCGYGSASNTDRPENYCTATVHRCMVYLKALTAEEIAYNYNVDKERFGL